MLNKETVIKNYFLIVRHAIVSIGSALIEVSLFYFFYSVCLFPLFISHSIAFICATTFGFVAHTFFTFKVNIISYRRALGFLTQALFVMLIGFGLLSLLIDMVQHPVVAKLAQLSCTFLVNLLIGKFVTFKK